MQSATVFLALGLLALMASASGQQYTTKYDGVDVDSILQNERLLASYFNCLMDRGKCSPDGAELKKNIPDALENDCSKCSENQKEGLKKVAKYIYEKKQEMFKEIEAKYDPEGKYRIKYKELAEKELQIKT